MKKRKILGIGVISTSTLEWSGLTADLGNGHFVKAVPLPDDHFMMGGTYFKSVLVNTSTGEEVEVDSFTSSLRRVEEKVFDAIELAKKITSVMS
jgi:hypothetical protein